MPLEVRFFVKSSLVYLTLTFALGAAMLIAEASGVVWPSVFAVEHAHLAFVGWLVNLVIGIALWLLPVNRSAFPRSQGRYPPRLVRTSFYLLNGGIILRVLTEPYYELVNQGSAVRSVLVLAGVAQFAAIIIFAAIAWRRVRQPSATTAR